MPYAYKIFLMPKIRADIQNELIFNPGIRFWAKAPMLSVVFLKHSLETISVLKVQTNAEIHYMLCLHLLLNYAHIECFCIWERCFSLKP